MKKSLRNILIISVTTLAFGILFSPSDSLQAQSLIVDFEAIPLFDEANFLPGESVVRWVKVTNNSTENQKIATEAVDYSGYPDPNLVPADDLSRALMIVIREKGGVDLYGGTTGSETLFNFYEDGEIYLSDISAGNFKEYEYEISFPSDKGNEWQGKTTFFDIVIGFQTEGEQGGGDGETQSVTGTGFLPPTLFIFNEENKTAETETAVVSWFTSTPATSRVIYDTAAHPVFLGSAPNYGYSFSTPEQDVEDKVTFHQVTITGLIPGVTYFWRAVSRGSPEVLGDELVFDTDSLPETPLAEESVPEEESPSLPENTAGEPFSAEATAGEGPMVFTELPEESEQEDAEEESSETTSTEEIIEDSKESIEEEVNEKKEYIIEEEKDSLSEEPVVSENTFGLLLADVGSIIGDILRGYSCLSWWIILVLVLYSLLKALDTWKKGKEEYKVWFIWTLVLAVLTVCFYFNICNCLTLWIFLLLGLITFLIRWVLLKKTENGYKQVER